MRFLAIIVGLVVATSPKSSACSLSFIPISVGPSFKVKVSGYAGPVKGLLLNLMGPHGQMLSAVTDDHGIARFSDIPPGTLDLGAAHDNGFGAELEVKSTGPRSAVVPMRWPSKEPIRVRSLSGTIRAPDAIEGEPEQPVLPLELLDAVSGRVLSSISTTPRGEFDFGKIAPGVYFIRLKGGLISIAVDPSAPAEADKIDLSLTWTSCGLMYMNLRQCPQPDLHVKKLAGHVSDSMGAAMGNAEIVLLDTAQNQAARLSADANGNFSSPDPLTGTFEFWVGEAGFNLVHTPLHIEPSASGSSLEVEIGFGSTCSSVRAK